MIYCTVSRVQNVVVPWAVQQSCSYCLRLRVLWKQNCIGLLAGNIPIQVENLDSNFQIVEKGHNLYLICFFIEGFYLCLAEKFYRKSIIYEGLIKNRIVFEFPRSQESHDQDDIIGYLWVTKDIQHMLYVINFRIIQFL